METNTKDRAFSKYVQRTGSAALQPSNDGDMRLDAPEEEDSDRYRAYKLGQQGRPQVRLRLISETGVISLMTYSYLTEAVCGSHQYLTLVFTNCIFDLFGRNLDALLDPLQDVKIRTLSCYNKTQFPEPAENEPVIYSIRRQSLYEARGAEEAERAERPR